MDFLIGSPQEVEEQIIDTLIAWKRKVDAIGSDMAAARMAIAKAKEIRVWEGKYACFKEWLEKECGITESWAYTMIGAAKAITQIEDAAAKSPEIAPAMTDQVKRRIRALPIRAIKELTQITPIKAAKIIAQASGDAETDAEFVAALKQDLKEATAKPIPAETPNLEAILKAVDSEWDVMRRMAAYSPLSPERTYARLREVVVKLFQ